MRGAPIARLGRPAAARYPVTLPDITRPAQVGDSVPTVSDGAIPTPSAYDFVAPARIVFGWGRRREAGPLVRALGSRAFLVLGSQTLESSGAVATLEQDLSAAGVETILLTTIRREPLVADVDQAAAAFRALGPRPGDVVVGMGGGSAIDLAKAVAALAPQREGTTAGDYLEGVGRGLKLAQSPLPLIALPTTAGTGSEATKNAVISSLDPPFKKSLRDDRLLPRLVIVDPELTATVPPDTTAWTGMDAITQLVESYVSRRARPIPQALAIDGLRYALPSIGIAVRHGTHRAARQAMAQAALLSGMALANSGLGMAHGVAAALGVHCRVPHGLACAVMLPAALAANRQVAAPQLARLARVVLNVTSRSESAAADAFIAHIEQLCDELGVPKRLAALGARAEQLPDLVRGSRGNSMDGNPRTLDDGQLHTLLEAML